MAECLDNPEALAVLLEKLKARLQGSTPSMWWSLIEETLDPLTEVERVCIRQEILVPVLVLALQHGLGALDLAFEVFESFTSAVDCWKALGLLLIRGDVIPLTALGNYMIAIMGTPVKRASWDDEKLAFFGCPIKASRPHIAEFAEQCAEMLMALEARDATAIKACLIALRDAERSLLLEHTTMADLVLHRGYFHLAVERLRSEAALRVAMCDESVSSIKSTILAADKLVGIGGNVVNKRLLDVMQEGRELEKSLRCSAIKAQLLLAIESESAPVLRNAILSARCSGILNDDALLNQAQAKFFDVFFSAPSMAPRWKYQIDETWMDFDSTANWKIESAYGTPQSPAIEINIGCDVWQLDFLEMEMRDVFTSQSRRIQRVLTDSVADIDVDYPPSHIPHEDGNVLCDVTSTMADQLQALLRDTCHQRSACHPSSPCYKMLNASVVKVQHLSSQRLWKVYSRKRECVREFLYEHNINVGSISPDIPKTLQINSCDASVNETYAFHGANAVESVDAILQFGFDSRVSQGIYGQGLYFTPSSCKAHQYAAHIENSEVHTIILARIVLGDPYHVQQSNSALRRPPDRSDLPGSVFDSVVASPGDMLGAPGSQQHHQELVLFDGNAAYPEFVIKYVLPE